VSFTSVRRSPEIGVPPFFREDPRRGCPAPEGQSFLCGKTEGATKGGPGAPHEKKGPGPNSGDLLTFVIHECEEVPKKFKEEEKTNGKK